MLEDSKKFVNRFRFKVDKPLNGLGNEMEELFHDRAKQFFCHYGIEVSESLINNQNLNVRNRTSYERNIDRNANRFSNIHNTYNNVIQNTLGQFGNIGNGNGNNMGNGNYRIAGGGRPRGGRAGGGRSGGGRAGGGEGGRRKSRR